MGMRTETVENSQAHYSSQFLLGQAVRMKTGVIMRSDFQMI